MGFEQIIGQERAIYFLARSMACGRLHHAYRFEGPAGVGKTMTAAAVAASLNCLDPAPLKLRGGFEEEGGEEVEIADFCGTCRCCAKIPVGGDYEAMEFPDIIFIAPEGASRVIRIEQIRRIQSIIMYSPVEGKARIVIVRDAENITEAASNAFLKILEEPPRDTYFFLTTSRPHKLLATIRSRTTAIRFAPLSVESILGALAGRYPGSDEEHLRLAASLGGGSFSRALAYAGDRGAAEQALGFVREFDARLMRQPRSILELLDASGVDKDNIEDFLHLLGIYYRDIAWYVETGSREGLMLRPIEDGIAGRAAAVGAEIASRICFQVAEGFRQLEINVNPRMILELIIFTARGAGRM
jgi:DNA polymerase-3 subunit delta'